MAVTVYIQTGIAHQLSRDRLRSRAAASSQRRLARCLVGCIAGGIKLAKSVKSWLVAAQSSQLQIQTSPPPPHSQIPRSQTPRSQCVEVSFIDMLAEIDGVAVEMPE